MKKRILGLVVLVMGLLSVYGTDSTPSVVLVSVRQRFPWNNIVDYTYTLSNLKSDGVYKLAVETTLNGGRVAETNDLTTVANGTYSGQLDLLTRYANGTRDQAANFKLTLLEVK